MAKQQYNLDEIYSYTDSQLDDYISKKTQEKYVSTPDRRYIVLKYLDQENFLDPETHQMVQSPNLFEALKVGEYDTEEVRAYLNPQADYAQKHKNIVAVLQRLSHIYDLLGSTCIGNAPRSGTCSTQNHFRSRAFNNSANQMNEYLGPLDAEHISGTPEIGPSSLSVILDVINTGRSKRLDLLEEGKDENGEQIFDPHMLATLDEFRGVFGIGPKKAIQYYREGYRSVKDLPSEKLTESENLSIKYREDLLQKIPRAEMDGWVQFFTTFFGNGPEDPKGKYYWAITGSYRRGESYSSDIDLITMNATPKDVVKYLGKYIVGTFALGDEKFLGLIQAGNTPVRRLDIRIFPKDTFYYGLLYNTGSQVFTIMMRQRSKDLGYKLDEYKLVDANGNYLPANSEQDIFNYLKVKYLSPKERTNMLTGLTYI